jgi:S1-C subfamily serine protease
MRVVTPSPEVLPLGILLLANAIAAGGEIDLADVFAKTSPSVVTVTTYNADGRKLGQGSGFVVDKSGVIVTCLHVVADGETVQVQSGDEDAHLATAIVRSDKQWDIALLRVEGLRQSALKLAGPESVRVGAPVVAIGSPLGLGNTLSQGIISGLRPRAGDGDLIQITAPVSPGSSGGPVLSPSTREVLGVTVSYLTSGQNLNFAVPARFVADQLKTIDQPPERKLRDFSAQIKRARAEAKKLRAALEEECTEADAAIINRALDQAIASGVDVYNAGDHLACYRIYEGAAYKALFMLSNRSPTAISVLKGALDKADAVEDGAGTAATKAWMMRNAFDSIIGVRGRKKPASSK